MPRAAVALTTFADRPRTAPVSAPATIPECPVGLAAYDAYWADCAARGAARGLAADVIGAADLDRALRGL